MAVNSDVKQTGLDDIVAQSSAMKQLISLARNVVDADINVIATGETGTGKELLARAIHYSSARKDAPFIAVNCAGIPDTLLESELFGHEKGAFTDAVQTKKGKFELTDGGTLFLDEIGDMSLMAQSKVLRAVESKFIDRVGGEKQIPVNCRIISATNKDLKQAVSRGEFREDLFYRLCEVGLHLPPLRERSEDIPLLAQHFIKIFNQEFQKQVVSLSDVVMSCFKRYYWPGNVRELKSVIRIGMALIQRDRIWLEDLPFKIEHLQLGDEECQKVEGCALADVERIHILKVLGYCQWNKAKTAELLKVSRPTLDRKIAKYGLRAGEST